MATIVDILTLVISAILLVKNIGRFRDGGRYIIYILVFLFYVFPLFLDYIIEFPIYYYWGFDISYKDEITRIIYDIGIIFLQCCLLYYKRTYSYKTSILDNSSDKSNALIIVGMSLPVVFSILLMNNIEILYIPMWRENEIFESTGSYSTIELFSYLGVGSSVLLLFQEKVNGGKLCILRVLAVLFLYMNICIQGKRGIVFFAFVIISIILLQKFIAFKENGRSVKSYAFVMITLVALMSGYMIYSSITVKVGRGFDESDQSAIYSTTRIDFFRDDRCRVAIFSEIKPDEMAPIDYYGLTIIDAVATMFPLKYFFNPKDYGLYTYQNYLSATMRHEKMPSELNHMTPSIYAEIISNFGIILGLLLFPFVCIWFSRLYDKYPYPYNTLIVSSFVLLNMFAENYISVYLEFTFIICVIYNNNKANSKVVRLKR